MDCLSSYNSTLSVNYDTWTASPPQQLENAQAIISRQIVPINSLSLGNSGKLAHNYNCNEQQGEMISTGECVRVVSGAFLGYYAMVVGESYGEELEIQYFKRRKSGGFLSLTLTVAQTDLRRVGKAHVDRSMHYFFE